MKAFEKPFKNFGIDDGQDAPDLYCKQPGFKKISRGHDNYEMKVYRSSNKYCKDCPLRSTCIGTSDFKGITESTEKPLYDAMHQKLQTPYAKGISKIRSKTVEPVMGTLINFTNMRRIYPVGYYDSGFTTFHVYPLG